MTRFALREHVPSIVVTTLSSAFGVSLLLITGNLGVVIATDDAAGSSETVAFAMVLVSMIFIVIAVYVGAVVTANTFATIIAGRTRSIALMRLVGATSISLRRQVASEGLMVGVIGAAIGVLIGVGATFGVIATAVHASFVPDLPYTYLQPIVCLPVVAVVLSTWLASWVGSRRVLTVTPLQAAGAAVEPSLGETTARPARNILAAVIFVVGMALLVMGIVIGLTDPAGVLVGLAGGILSFTGVIMGSMLVMPPALKVVGRMLGRSTAARLAAENAVRYPERSTQTTIGLVISVTLVTTFAVAVGSFQAIITAAQDAQPEVYEGTDQILAVTVVIFTVLIGFSALIAGIGMVNTLSISVLQRTRELGLLRALGFTSAQLRSMIRAESVQLTVTAVIVGLALGIFYGWAGAQSLLGSITGSPGLVVPVVPVWLPVVIAVSAAVLSAAASRGPTRRATCISPIEALAVD